MTSSDYLIRDFDQVDGGGWAVLHAPNTCVRELGRVTAAHEAHQLGEGWYGADYRYPSNYPARVEEVHRARFTVPLQIHRCECVAREEERVRAELALTAGTGD